MKNVIIVAARKGSWWDVWTEPSGFLSAFPRAGALYPNTKALLKALHLEFWLRDAKLALENGREVMMDKRWRVQRLSAFRAALRKAGDAKFVDAE